MARALLWAAIVGVLVGLGALLLVNPFAAPRPPQPEMRATNSPSPRSNIALANASDQAVRGAEIYAMRCITCHGDRGQGLTLEWRLTWDEEHQNCAKPKCHGRDNPEGFYLPNMYAPAIVGPGTLTKFKTARDLFAFIHTVMPFQEPGILPQEDYWALTAYLLRQNGITLPGAEVGEDNASTILLHPSATPAAPGSGS